MFVDKIARHLLKTRSGLYLRLIANDVGNAYHVSELIRHQKFNKYIQNITR